MVDSPLRSFAKALCLRDTRGCDARSHVWVVCENSPFHPTVTTARQHQTCFQSVQIRKKASEATATGNWVLCGNRVEKILEMSDIDRYTEGELGDCSRKESVTLIRKSSSSDESLKTTFRGGFFVSAETIPQIAPADLDLTAQKSAKMVYFFHAPASFKTLIIPMGYINKFHTLSHL